MNEVWKPIAGYPDYQVSNLGRVQSFKRKKPRILKATIYDTGYFYVSLVRDKKHKNYSVHRLVAEAFIPNPDNKPEVNHLNGIKTDCRVENLEWATRAENAKHSFDNRLQVMTQGEDCSWSKLTNEQVRYIRENPDNLTRRQLAEMFGMSPASIGDVQLGRSYKNAGGKIRGKIEQRIPDDVREQICRDYKPGVRGCGCRVLAKKYGVSDATILRIVREGVKSCKS